jgi:hypothetical protein
MDYCHRQLAAFDHDFRTRAYPRQQAGEVAGSVRFLDVDHRVSHGAIIPSFLPARFSFQTGQQFALVLQGRAGGSISRKETDVRSALKTAVRRVIADAESPLGDCVETRSLILHIVK